MPAPKKSKLLSFDLEQIQESNGIIGVDEAGRGALAGPVMVGAVWIRKDFYASKELKEVAEKVNDSKQLTEKQRESIYKVLLTWKEEGLIQMMTQEGSVTEIERRNILGATQLAVGLILESWLKPIQIEERPLVLIDGKPMRNIDWDHRAVVRGDGRSLAIAMASIAAKVSRDQLMNKLALDYPYYDFPKHKGYATERHRREILENGVSDIHRRLFVRSILDKVAEKHQQESFLFDN